MQTRTSPLSPEIWQNDLFTSKAVAQGGVIRRKARDIERFAGMDLFMAEINRRGYQVGELRSDRSHHHLLQSRARSVADADLGNEKK